MAVAHRVEQGFLGDGPASFKDKSLHVPFCPTRIPVCSLSSVRCRCAGLSADPRRKTHSVVPFALTAVFLRSLPRLERSAPSGASAIHCLKLLFTEQLSVFRELFQVSGELTGANLGHRFTNWNEHLRCARLAIPFAQYEFIDCEKLASRWALPETWVREQVRSRAVDPLPHVRFGKYVRFRWASPELEAWAERRIINGSNRDAGRVSKKEIV